MDTRRRWLQGLRLVLESRGRAGVGGLFVHWSSLEIFYHALSLDGSLANTLRFRPEQKKSGSGTKKSSSIPKRKYPPFVILWASFEVLQSFGCVAQSGSGSGVGLLLEDVAGAGSSSSVLQASAWLHTGLFRQPWGALLCSHWTVRLQKWIKYQ